ncbi:MAG: DUF2723 domain-containing protein [Actinomycetota bacterium]|nr:DUF2723 domain-containing protein [Actinomycetota bacterium]
MGRPGAASLGAVVGLFVFLLYLGTLAPTVLYYDYPELFDPAMLQAEASVLGIGHPSGYPTYMMLTHLFTYLPFGDGAYGVNLASAVYGTLAIVAIYGVALRLSGYAAAAVGALALGVSPLFWSQAVIAEVYTLNALFIAVVVSVLLLWRDRRNDRYLLLAAFLMGLSLTHHLTSGLLIPAGLAFVFAVDRKKLRRPGLLLKGLGLFLVGLLPYLYLPIRAAMEAPLNEADPSSPGRFLLLVTGGSYLLKLLADLETGAAPGSDEVPSRSQPILQDVADRLTIHGEYLYAQFPLLLMLAGLLGALHLVRKDRAAALLLGITFLGWLVHALTYGVEDYYIFLLPAYVILSLFVAVGVGVVLRKASSLAGRLVESPRSRTALVLVLSGLALAVPLFGVRESYASEDRSGEDFGRRTIESVAENVAPDATVLHHRSSLWYMVLVENRRRDLTLVDPFKTSWLRYEDVVWPDRLNATQSAERYGTADISGVEAARRAAEEGPVYLLDHDILGRVVGEGTFREAGFETVPVDAEVGLYELVPEGGEPYGAGSDGG